MNSDTFREIPCCRKYFSIEKHKQSGPELLERQRQINIKVS